MSSVGVWLFRYLVTASLDAHDADGLVRGCGRWGSNSYGQLLHHGSTAVSPVELTQAMLGFNPSDIRSIQAGTSGASCGIAVLCTCLCVFGDSDSTSLNCTRVH